MRIIFVRHGDPDYQNDCLTPRGRLQAAAVAERLKDENISEIYASPLGRAQETAGYTARILDLPVKTLDYMPEIVWSGDDLPFRGHPWVLSSRMITEENFDFFQNDWKEHPYFRDNDATRCFNTIASSFDRLMKDYGFEHDGRRFLCSRENQETIAVFSHGGSGAAAMAHMLSLPLPYALTFLPYDFTSVCILNFPDRAGEYVIPRLEIFNDIKHLNGELSSPLFQKALDQHAAK